MNPSAPNPEIIFSTLNAYQRSAALKGAIDLGLFTAVGQGNDTPEKIAAVCQADARAVRMVCDFLVVDQLLLKQNHRYTLSPTAAVFLDEKSPQYLGSIAKFTNDPILLTAFTDMKAVMQNGGTVLPQGGTTQLDFDRWVEFAESMEPLMQAPAGLIAGQVAAAFGDQPIRVLDLAASHGLFGIRVAQQCAAAEITGLDFEAVLEVAIKNAADAGLADQYTTIAGDAFAVDFGTGYDCVLITNLLHHFPLEKCEELLRKVRACLKETGMVITLEFVPNEDRVSPPVAATFALTMLASTPNGDAYVFSEYEKIFTAAGFTQNELMDVPNSPQRVIVSRV
ncbi:MAG: methyltransferase type 12 [Blastopirellula sp.]|nr:MAG: methyltransferase type 12 [Blastopirellula sp.]